MYIDIMCSCLGKTFALDLDLENKQFQITHTETDGVNLNIHIDRDDLIELYSLIESRIGEDYLNYPRLNNQISDLEKENTELKAKLKHIETLLQRTIVEMK